jgi:hypothetical protein
MTAAVILIILMALALGMLSFAGRARMNNAVFDVASLISAAQLRAVSSGVPHFILIHRPPQRGASDDYLRIHILERPDELGPTGVPLDFNDLDLTNGPEAALAFLDPATGTARNAFNRGTVGLAISTANDRRDVSFLDLNSTRVRGLLRPPFNTISLDTDTEASPLDLPSGDLLTGCNFCVNPAGDEPHGVLRFNADGTMQVMTGPPTARSGAAIAFAPNTDDERTVVPRLLVVAAPAGATIVY